ncbi:hypothetical protein N476_19695 [Pseudoalteromonas luteoviolacea H33]|uniref:Uncharacterized protein n=1 Tax=Pseudoalteromonas luteoviolacea H33 TaxID=1365251 RepID=A0A167DRZ5_9GAMM|nr:hypothetical protein N476_19695 [Pseudoalteromonas luteoviolacea H33]KZN74923.1 hypothetical protein N477_21095 [Pseudoalteromonas luteoviolacea H33-S]
MKLVVKKLKELSLSDAKRVVGAAGGGTSGPQPEEPK